MDRTNNFSRHVWDGVFMKTFQTTKAHDTLPWAKNRSDGFVRFVSVLELLGALGMIFPLLTGILPG